MSFGESMKKLLDLLKETNDKEGYLTTVRTTNLLNELFETLKILEKCASCKDNGRTCDLDKFRRLINKIRHRLVKLEEEIDEESKVRKIHELDDALITIDD